MHEREEIRRKFSSSAIGHLVSRCVYVCEVMVVGMIEGTSWALASLNLVLDSAGPVRFTDRIQFRKQDYFQSEELLAPLGDSDDHPNAILCIIKVGFAAKEIQSVQQTAAH